MFDDAALHAVLTEADALDDAWDAGWEDWPTDAPSTGRVGPVRTGHVLLGRVVAEQRCLGAAAARQVVALASLFELYTERDASDPAARAGAVGEVADEVGAALGLTGWSATRLVERAAQLGSVLPATLTALASGGLDLHRAGMIADATALLSGEHAGEVDARLCGSGGRALGLTSGQLRPVVRDVLAEVDAAAVVRRSRAAVAARRVAVQGLEDGMAELVATGPAPAVHAMREAIGALGRAGQDAARRGTGAGDPWSVPGVDGAADLRGLDAHRFDALHDALVGAAAGSAAAGGAAAAAPGPPTVLVGLSTLLGLDDACGQLSGYGPVPAWMARQAARGARLRRIMTDPFTGALVGVDGHTYPPGWLDGPGRDGEPPAPGPGPGPAGPAGPDPGPGPTPAPSPVPVPVPVDRRTPHSGCTRIDPRACPVGMVGGGPYRVPAALARFVRTRWDRCTAPRCRRPAAHTDLDHVVAHPAGPTCGCNLAPLCRYHHLMKHGTPRTGDRTPRADWARRAGTRRRRWAVHRCSDGHQHWTSPLGQRHVVAPPRLLPALPDAGPGPARPPTSTGPLDPLRYPRGAAEWRSRVTTATATAAATAAADPTARGTRDEPLSDGFRERLAAVFGRGYPSPRPAAQPFADLDPEHPSF